MAPADGALAPLLSIGLIASTVLLTTAAAEPTPDKQRSIAIVEFRSGSSAVPEIGARIARRLTVLTGLGVLAPAAARQQVERLDSVVNDCAGDPLCLSAIGRELNVDEVLLVGLSELGDVILTLQRVVVAREEISARMAETLTAKATPSDAELERFLRAVLPASDFEQWGRIRVDSNVASAAVRINDRPVGVTPLDPVTVKAPGNYQVEVNKSGYTNFRARIAVTPNALVVVNPELNLQPRDVCYKKWWVLAIAGAVTVGAVSTTIILTQAGSDGVSVMVEPFDYQSP